MPVTSSCRYSLGDQSATFNGVAVVSNGRIGAADCLPNLELTLPHSMGMPGFVVDFLSTFTPCAVAINQKEHNTAAMKAR